MSDFKLEKRKLTSLVADVHSGKIQLPQFQRDYKWKPKSVMKLLDSINKLHPAGSLLFLEVDVTKEPLIAYDKVKTAPDTASTAKPSYLILDGQQRLTSCHSAFTNTGERSYYIDLLSLQKNYHGKGDNLDLIDDKILIVKKHIPAPDQLLFSSDLLPCSYLLKIDEPQKSKEELRKKLYTYKESLRSKPDMQTLKSLLKLSVKIFSTLSLTMSFLL